ncbi:hypothetical protein SISNIDRAFT_489146 [Sistotremastrum niveocremeum HHB9708]|uniref:DUF6534 domain-containing protein n=1 Tax=Sistotremastrum niveocremeum HHB9708 TaxID=1314777 RepID=A0A164Q9X2_9AGAM|nr:hypothetical protein SISNIDRAFT_489146 [Sistotremastrum niveocremeum HHB9708]
MTALPANFVSSFEYVLVGVLVTSLLHGFTTFQCIIYYRNFPADSWLVKLIVIVVATIEFLHLASCWHFQFVFFRDALENPIILLKNVWSSVVSVSSSFCSSNLRLGLQLTVPLTMTILSISHVFFTNKLWKSKHCDININRTDHNWIVCAPIAVMEFTCIGFEIVFVSKIFRILLWPEIAIKLRFLGTIIFIIVVCVDLAIAAGLCYYLHKSRTGFQRTDNVLTWLLYFTINNGILTTHGDAGTSRLLHCESLKRMEHHHSWQFLGVPNSLAFFAVFEVISKVYASAILTSLNTRTILRNQLLRREVELYPDQTLQSRSSARGGLPWFSKGQSDNSIPLTLKGAGPGLGYSFGDGQNKREYTATSPLDTVVKIDPMPTEPNSGLHGSDIGEECSLEAMVILSICHVFFTVKLWKISDHNWIICAPIAALELTGVGFQIVFIVRLFGIPLWPEIAIRLRVLVTIVFVLVVSIDLAIAAGLCYYLRKWRTGYQRTDNILSQLLYFTINNGILTSLVDMAMMGLFLGLSNNLAFFAVFEVISKVYAAAILTSLNTRKTLRNQYAGEIEVYHGTTRGRLPWFSKGSPDTGIPLTHRTSVLGSSYEEGRLKSSIGASPIAVVDIARTPKEPSVDVSEASSLENSNDRG